MNVAGVKKVKAKELRNKSKLELVPRYKPGYYKWWASKADLEKLLVRLDQPFSQIADCLECNDEDQYCIYIGIAVKESVHSRLNWHINQKCTESNVKHRTLSTLKQTVAALVCDTMLENDKIDAFIDGLTVEYFWFDYEIKSKEAVHNISTIEDSYLKESDKLYVLNIQKNGHPKSCKTQLKILRKKARDNALNSK